MRREIPDSSINAFELFFSDSPINAVELFFLEPHSFRVSVTITVIPLSLLESRGFGLIFITEFISHEPHSPRSFFVIIFIQFSPDLRAFLAICKQYNILHIGNVIDKLAANKESNRKFSSLFSTLPLSDHLVCHHIIGFGDGRQCNRNGS